MSIKTYHRYAFAAGLAMALGPLTALSVASLTSDGRVVSSDSIVPQSQNATRMVSSEYQGKRLADVTAGAGSLEFFSSVLEAAEVKNLLRSQEQFTVFVPVNEAFSALGGERLSTMLNDTEQVRRLAKAHVVPGRVTAPELMAETQLRSINGHEITSQVGAELTVNGASIIGSEVAENGIVHYVDRLL